MKHKLWSDHSWRHDSTHWDWTPSCSPDLIQIAEDLQRCLFTRSLLNMRDFDWNTWENQHTSVWGTSSTSEREERHGTITNALLLGNEKERERQNNRMTMIKQTDRWMDGYIMFIFIYLMPCQHLRLFSWLHSLQTVNYSFNQVTLQKLLTSVPTDSKIRVQTCAGVSVSLIGWPSNLNLICLMDKPWK